MIASIGLTNNSSLNIFSVSYDYVVCGFNAQNTADCDTYEIQCALFDEDDEFSENGEYRAYILIDDIPYFIDEMIRTDILGLY